MSFPLFAPRRALSHGATDDRAPAAPANTRVASIMGGGVAPHGRAREVAALLIWTTAIFLLLALSSYAGEPAASSTGVAPPTSLPPPTIVGPNWVGPVGESCARALVTFIGVIAWAIPFELALLGIPFVRGRRSEATPARLAGDILILVVISGLVQVGWPGHVAFGKHVAGGLVGELFGELARSLFSTIGSFLVGFACLGLILIGRASFSFIALVRLLAFCGAHVAAFVVGSAKGIAEAWRTSREIEREARERERLANRPHIEMTPAVAAAASPFRAFVPALDDAAPATIGVAEALAESERTPAPPKRRARKRKGLDQPLPGAGVEVEVAPPSIAPPTTPASAADDDARRSEPELEAVSSASSPLVPVAVEDPKPRRPRDPKEPAVPTIVDTTAALVRELDKVPPAAPVARPEKPARAPHRAEHAPKVAAFRLPPVDYLVPAKVDPSLVIDRDILFRNAELLVKTLSDYGVSGKVEDILPGPTVTTYEVSPAAGTKVSKVASLADDLALALAKKVRIVAPIPGKNRIGFELPNDRRVAVNLRDLCEDRRFQSLEVPLPVVLGRDIVGNPVYADLASMPHVIVAGATGAGKSVGLNVMLTSLLYRRSPDELRLLMIDPKVVELAPFDRIPHMLLPVVTDMKQAATALKWAVNEMERRYQLFADAGTKNIGTYNGWVARVVAGEVRNPLPRQVIAKDHNGLPEALPPEAGEAGTQPLPERLPFIVIVVDEFADLMMQQGKEVEACVARLAQKARAAGMHVILATQRPSVDVITGMIKANFPTRIAFRVAQKVDSRTILDEQGAEHLLGSGDMLIKLNGTNETKRVQCPWVSESEVQLVTDFLRQQGEPVYDDNILKPTDEDEEAAVEDDGEQDPMYDDAVRIVSDTRRCSTSWLQRKLGLGYNRAARIVETMERRGLVGPANGAKDREVLIDAL